MLIRIRAGNTRWLEDAAATLEYHGCVIIEDVIPIRLLQVLREALYRCKNAIEKEVGLERLQGAGEVGVIRLPMKFERVFFSLLELDPVLRIVDATVGDTAILHLQNGFILPSFAEGETPHVFQNTFHRDFPRYLNGYLASINTFFAIDPFTKDNGATLVVPGTHQRAVAPSQDYLRRHAVPAEAPAGAMLVFDSTLWHAAGYNVSGNDRLAVNQQFTRSWIKQQIDYVRALGDDVVQSLSPRTQQLLGWYTRVVTSLDEYYRPEDQRLYRKGQG